MQRFAFAGKWPGFAAIGFLPEVGSPARARPSFWSRYESPSRPKPFPAVRRNSRVRAGGGRSSRASRSVVQGT
jgi:hypothetical protein